MSEFPCPTCGQPTDMDPRTLPQNSYHWLLCTLIADYSGYTQNEASQIMCDMTFGEKTLDYGGQKLPMPHSISKLNKVEQAKLIETDIEVCNRFNIVYPIV